MMERLMKRIKMERLTKRINGVVTYIGEENSYDTGQIAAELNAAARREILERLADYEDTERRPASMADVERAKDKARTETVRTSWSVFFTVLRDKEGMSNEDLGWIYAEVEALSDSVIRGYCSISDLRDTLRREAGILIE